MYLKRLCLLCEGGPAMKSAYRSHWRVVNACPQPSTWMYVGLPGRPHICGCAPHRDRVRLAVDQEECNKEQVPQVTTTASRAGLDLQQVWMQQRERAGNWDSVQGAQVAGRYRTCVVVCVLWYYNQGRSAVGLQETGDKAGSCDLGMFFDLVSSSSKASLVGCEATYLAIAPAFHGPARSGPVRRPAPSLTTGPRMASHVPQLFLNTTQASSVDVMAARAGCLETTASNTARSTSLTNTRRNTGSWTAGCGSVTGYGLIYWKAATTVSNTRQKHGAGCSMLQAVVLAR
ncbi:hypothetical protein BD289DRAFT_281868 [Coniella lustricola]|uniref:Uncharacterized protein n=1 Tax=Coniella lustricola TaxID=2025994 RepID=A0A2T3A5Z0_9PEZI|nr:hypothetical protein BD289DRAFT_281868 [Coniella lustricola]